MWMFRKSEESERDYLLTSRHGDATGSGSDEESTAGSCCRLVLCSIALTGVLALGALVGASLGYEVGLNVSLPRVPFNGSFLSHSPRIAMLGIGGTEEAGPRQNSKEAPAPPKSSEGDGTGGIRPALHTPGGDRSPDTGLVPVADRPADVEVGPVEIRPVLPKTTPEPEEEPEPTTTEPELEPEPSPELQPEPELDTEFETTLPPKRRSVEEISEGTIDEEDLEWKRKQPLWRMEEAEWRERNALNQTIFYMYRAQSDKDYPEVNVNMADLSGVLWYLHHEVVRITPRKYGVTRILRFLVTVKNTEALQHAVLHKFGPFVAFDAGKCTVPTCDQIWGQYGFVVGCQVIASNTVLYPRQRPCDSSTASCKGGIWYSLPGPCPSMDYRTKTEDCKRVSPGGECGTSAVTGEAHCTYHVEKAGSVDLDEFSFIKNYTGFVEEGRREYDPFTDRGERYTFWDGMKDLRRCMWRLNRLELLFKRKYPDLPAVLDPPACPG